MSTVVDVPSSFARSTISAFVNALQDARDDDVVIVDFARLAYSRPLPMLVAGSAIKQFVGHRKEAGLVTKADGLDEDVAVQSYLQHLGFFQFIGLPFGKAVGQASGNAKYIPIECISRDSLYARVDPVYRPLRQVIKEDTAALARVLLARETDEQSREALSYSLREVVRNVFEHSRADECFVCAQRWYDGSVQLGILDDGRGIPDSLADAYPGLTHRQSLEHAIRPGVSRVRDELENRHDNSGYGLYVLSELGDECGWFSVGSGDYMLTRAKSSRDDEIEEIPFSGTFVGLHLDRGITSDFRTKVGEIIYSGEQEARMLGTNPEASRSSRDV